MTLEEENKLFLLNSELSKEVQMRVQAVSDKLFQGYSISLPVRDARVFQRKVGHQQMIINWNTTSI